MKRLTSSIFALLALGGSASAADLILADAPMAPEPASASVVDWSGPYAGVVVGFGSGVVDYSDIGAIPAADPTISGGLLGATLGYNIQFDTVVLGLEGDIAWSNFNGSLSNGAGVTFESDVNWIGTVRGRVGVALDPFLLYATAGLAAGRLTTELQVPPGTAYSDTHIGWTAGIGAEAMLTDDISLKAEYAYTDLGSKTIPTGSLFPGSTSNTADPSFHTVKFGANFHF